MLQNWPLTKILVGSLVLAVVGGGLVAWRIFFTPASSLQVPIESEELQTLGSVPVPTTNSLEERIRALEVSLAEVVDVLKNNKSASTLTSSTTSSLDSRVKALEISVLDLKSRVKILEGGSSSTTTTNSTTSKSPVYIPLNWVATTTSSDWSSPGVAEVSISGADHSGYTSMVLELSIKSATSGKRAYGRLFNKDDNSAIGSSEASTDVSAYTQANSGGFTLPASRKSYYLQMKSQDGVGASIQNATIKVNF